MELMLEPQRVVQMDMTAVWSLDVKMVVKKET
jgi:hypothetical protein